MRHPVILSSGRNMLGLALSALAFILLAVNAGHAEDYPARPIRMIVPLAAGGGTDLLARIIGEDMSQTLGQPVIVDNRPGAGTQIGAEVVAKAPADGYTLLSASMTTYAFNPGLYSKLRYDPVKDFATISLTGRFTLVLLAHKSFAPNTLAEFVALAKAKPGTINFASSGPGSPHQLAMELLAARAGIKLVHVPYKGAAPALQDLMAGHVPVMITDYASSRQAITSGLVKVLAVASPDRLAELPNVPTIAESGYPGFEASAWQGIVAPKDTPQPIIDKLNAAIVKALQNPALRAKLVAIGIEPISSTPAEFSAYMQAEIAKWREVIKAANITTE
ncbi:Bug family tripartite tricarboxylate transporter substrate binding protein [Pseudolabrys taiwanensis]|nr:tripartite tricarboxylate transporter substrate binding protein [Pseudolabrys taiwanensis]